MKSKAACRGVCTATEGQGTPEYVVTFAELVSKMIKNE